MLLVKICRNTYQGAIQNEQARATGNIVHTNHRTQEKDKQHKTHNTENKKDEKHRPHQKHGRKLDAVGKDL
jgi:DNA invertase Pin-like site-specific DNA recombinase